MIKADPDFFKIIQKSHSVAVQAAIYTGSTNTNKTVKVTQGRISADRGQRVRRSLDCSVALNYWEDRPIDVISSRLVIYYGVYNAFKVIWIPVGVFRVDSLGRNDRGEISVAGTSMESYVIDNVFESTKTFNKGVSIITTIKQLVSDSIPDAVWESAVDAPANSIPADANLDVALIVERDRWEAIESLSRKLTADVYCGPDGKFRIRKKVSLYSGQAIGTIKEGTDGVLLKLNTRVSRDEIYNAVLAMGQSSSPDVAPASSWVKDDKDPKSPTYWGGPFGKKTYVYENSLLTSTALCTSQAKLLLEQYKSEVRSVDFSAIPNAAIEPDDIFNISMLDGSQEKHMIGTFTIPLGTGEWAGTTVSARVADPVPDPG